MLHQYRIKLTPAGDTIVDGRFALPLSLYVVSGTVSAAPGVDQTGPWGPSVAQTVTAGSITSIDTSKLPYAPWYKFTASGSGTLFMQERTGGGNN